MLGRKSSLPREIGYFSIERPHPKLSSVKMTDLSASYKSNCNFNLKFYHRLSVLRKTLALIRN